METVQPSETTMSPDSAQREGTITKNDGEVLRLRGGAHWLAECLAYGSCF